MQDFVIYVLALSLMAVAVLSWYLNRGTPAGRKIGMVAALIVVGVLVVISMKRRIPLVSNIIGWVKDRFADSKIKDLDKDIKSLEDKKAKGVVSANELGEQAEDLRNKALEHKKNVDALNSLTEKQISGQDAYVDAGLPTPTGDPLADAKSLLESLRQRRMEGKL